MNRAQLSLAPYQSLLLQEVVGLLSLFAVLILQLLKPTHTHTQTCDTNPLKFTPLLASLSVIARISVPLLHFLFHVNALFLQQLPLGKGPVHRLSRRLGTWGPLPLSSGLDRVVEPEHVTLSQDDAISCGAKKKSVTLPLALLSSW